MRELEMKSRKGIMVTGNAEIFSVFAAQERVEIIGQFESGDSMINSTVVEKAEFIVIEANDENFERIKLAERIADSKMDLKVYVLIGKQSMLGGNGSEELIGLKNNKNMKCFYKPWNYKEILDEVIKCSNQQLQNTFDEKTLSEQVFNVESKVKKKVVNHSPVEQGRAYQFDDLRKDINIERNPHSIGNKNRVIAVLNSKGGIGKTFFSINYACEIAKSHPNEVVLVDANLGSGDMAVHLDMLNTQTIIDLLPEIDNLDSAKMNEWLPSYQAVPMRVLLGPNNPEMCEFVESSHLKRIIQILRESYGTVIVDTASNSYNMITYEILDLSTTIVLLTTCELTSLQQARKILELMRRLEIDIEDKVSLVVNKLSTESTLSPKRIEEFLQLKIRGVIPEDNHSANLSITNARPIVVDSRSTTFREEIEKVIHRIHFNGDHSQYLGMKKQSRSFLKGISQILGKERSL